MVRRSRWISRLACLRRRAAYLRDVAIPRRDPTSPGRGYMEEELTALEWAVEELTKWVPAEAAQDASEVAP